MTRQKMTRRIVCPGKTFAPDIFEFVYFARPDSTIDGISVYRSRMKMGELLGETAKKELVKAGLNVDVVIPVSFPSLLSRSSRLLKLKGVKMRSIKEEGKELIAERERQC